MPTSQLSGSAYSMNWRLTCVLFQLNNTIVGIYKCLHYALTHFNDQTRMLALSGSHKGCRYRDIFAANVAAALVAAIRHVAAGWLPVLNASAMCPTGDTLPAMGRTDPAYADGFRLSRRVLKCSV